MPFVAICGEQIPLDKVGVSIPGLICAVQDSRAPRMWNSTATSGKKASRWVGSAIWRVGLQPACLPNGGS